MTKRIFLLIFILMLSYNAFAETRIKGSIGPYQVTIVIDGTYNGYYYYDSRPNTKFKLKCVRIKNTFNNYSGNFTDDVVIQEYSPKGVNTGTFRGSISGAVGRGLSFGGTFTNNTTKKKFSFSAFGKW